MEDPHGSAERPPPERDTPAEGLFSELGEVERRMLARCLHDDVGQKLTGVALLLRALTDRLTSVAPEEAETAASITTSLREAIGGVRRISRSIMTVPPNGAGVRDSLESIVAQTASAIGLRYDLDMPDEIALADRRAISVLCHVAREALFYAADRWHAAHVVVRLASQGSVGTLEIDDDGPVQSAEDDPLVVMRERAALLGGDLTVHDRAGRGHRLVYTFRPSS